jgi:hypothetical protein
MSVGLEDFRADLDSVAKRRMPCPFRVIKHLFSGLLEHNIAGENY